ncbi:DMT family transporter [Nitratireductor pacificus]|uniref:Spermidine export protein MdtJ n=1 Tax=Nitratireductor pacificus pht-3B TaxID=391937 RepID=K2LPW9_9HYPH|nr:SMR family transporter [Nitratireductor pacificus]EKF19744.1 SMR family multidrug efflux pump [Nitratireductor pacificus pht-3B]
MKLHWLYLIAAVSAEVVGTTLMKLLVSAGHLAQGTLAAIIMVGLAYLLLGKATHRIPVALANALWEGFGMILIALVSLHLLDESISAMQAVGIGTALLGIAVINVGHYRQEHVR